MYTISSSYKNASSVGYTPDWPACVFDALTFKPHFMPYSWNILETLEATANIGALGPRDAILELRLLVRS